MEWEAFCEYEPLPDPYWIGAQICSVVANSQRARGPAFKVDDFIPRVRPERRQSVEEMQQALRSAIRRAGQSNGTNT